MNETLCSLSASSVAALAAVVTAIAAIVTAAIIYRQVRQERRLDRLMIGVDALFRLQEEWDSGRMTKKREAAASELLAEQPNLNVEEVLDWFETVAFLVRKEAIDEEITWHTFYYWMAHYWCACERYIGEIRKEEGESTWADFCDLMPRLFAREKTRPAASEVRGFLEDETRLSAQTD